ncbi:MAG TPA: TonB-dependent receptor plug domain-containing protein [Kofleriaceae bacterium]|nr:TonB-dependent receptor plug domain-containing protein [Kofleriaceae bacterium]
MTRVLVAALLAASVADAAPRVVRGVVVHGNQPIAGASVLAERGAIAVTDVDGYFVLELGERDRELTVVAQGYVTRSVRVSDNLRIELASAAGSEVIEVRGKAPEETKPLRYTLTVDEIRTIPGAGNDILRAAQVLPGVARIPFSFGGLVLRGTSPRDTAVYLDGVEVPVAFHFGGVTSFYPSGMLADLTLVNGGFDASYGRAQGGLVTLTTREPRTDRWRLGGSVGLFDSSIQAEGPWYGGGVLVGLRRSYFDQVADPFVSDDIALPSYYDFQIRTSWGDPTKRGRMTPTIFGSIDRVASRDLSVTSMFVRAAVPFQKQWGALTLRIVPWLGTNRLTFREEEDDDERDEEFSRPVYLGGVRSELVRDYRWGHLRGALELSSGYLDQLVISTDDEELGGNTTVSWTDIAASVEGRFKLDGERFAIKPGLRIEAYGLSSELVVDPRLNIHQRLTDWLTLRQAIGRYHQPPTPGDVDEASGNPALDSSYNDQLSLGVDAMLPGDWLVALTGFFSYGTGHGVEVRGPAPGNDLPEPNSAASDRRSSCCSRSSSGSRCTARTSGAPAATASSSASSATSGRGSRCCRTRCRSRSAPMTHACHSIRSIRGDRSSSISATTSRSPHRGSSRSGSSAPACRSSPAIHTARRSRPALAPAPCRGAGNCPRSSRSTCARTAAGTSAGAISSSTSTCRMRRTAATSRGATTTATSVVTKTSSGCP